MPTHWTWRTRAIGTALWSAFLCAGIGTTLFFAFVEPQVLGDQLFYPAEVSDTAILSLTFFFFWVISTMACLLNAWMIRTARRRADFPSAAD